MKKRFLILFLFLFQYLPGIAQPCLQLGSLVSVRNISAGKYEYIVFKFLKPHTDKGVLSSGTAELFPFNKGKKHSYHKIAFNNVTHLCYNKLNVVPKGKKIVDFKVLQKTDNTISYVFELIDGAKITKHYITQQQNYYFVKIRIE